MVYLKGILPLSSQFASSINDFFVFYEALNFQEWCEKLSSIHEETVGYKQLCEALPEDAHRYFGAIEKEARPC